MDRKRDEPNWVSKRRKKVQQASLTEARPKPKSLYRQFLESLVGGGIAVALVTGSLQFLNSDDEPISRICDNAFAAILDDSLNDRLSQEQSAIFLERQLQIAEECGRRRS